MSSKNELTKKEIYQILDDLSSKNPNNKVFPNAVNRDILIEGWDAALFTLRSEIEVHGYNLAVEEPPEWNE